MLCDIYSGSEKNYDKMPEPGDFSRNCLLATTGYKCGEGKARWEDRLQREAEGGQMGG